ncbi:MAG: hypothetical protein AAGA59_12680 [Actinomycetota bacterium]
MASTNPPLRDLTDRVQNLEVLHRATTLLEASRSSGGPIPPSNEATDGVEAEARAAARSRQRLADAVAAGAGPVHLSVVWAMYGETGRIRPREEHPHGEDFLRVKTAQLDWLIDGLPGATWSIVAVDDGCPDVPSSAEVMAEVATAEGYPRSGDGAVRVLRLAEEIGRGRSISPAFDRLRSADESRKGGSILVGLASAVETGPRRRRAGEGAHVVCYTDADLSANLAQLGALTAPVVAGRGAVAGLGQRYGLAEAVLVKADGPCSEPSSTGGKPDKAIILFRHMVRALLIPDLAHVLDTQAGFKAVDAGALEPVLARMSSFDETFDVELLIHLAQAQAQAGGAAAMAAEPIVFTEDFAATNFPSVDPGQRHLDMVHQIVDVYDRLVAPVAPATGEAAALLDLVRGLSLPAYVRVIERLRADDDPADTALFDRRWSVDYLSAAAAADLTDTVD